MPGRDETADFIPAPSCLAVSTGLDITAYGGGTMSNASNPMPDTSKARRTRDRSSIKVKIAGAWTARPNRLLKDTRLSRDARLLGALMFLHAANRGTAFPSQQELAEELSHTAEIVEHDPTTGAKATRYEYRQVSVRSVQRWLTELKRCGWLEWRQTLKNNAYTLLDPTEPGEAPDSSDNEALTGATAVSYGATEGSPSDATEGSDHTTAVSSQVIPLSSSTFMHEDSWDIDSSSSESPPTRPGDDDAVVIYLRSLGINAAEEFRHLNLAAVQERVALLQRDPNCRPGGIVKSLRNSPPHPALVYGSSAYLAQLNAEYGDLFRSGSDMSGLAISADELSGFPPDIALLVQQIAPPDATEEEIAWLATAVLEGASAEVARAGLQQRRADGPQPGQRSHILSELGREL